MDFGYVPLLSAFEGSSEHRFCVGGSAGSGGVVDQPAEGAHSFSLLVCACGFGGGALVSNKFSHSKCRGFRFIWVVRLCPIARGDCTGVWW
jgi:hypothetical protein